MTGHTIYTRNNIGQKCEGNCGLWVLNEILKNWAESALLFSRYLQNGTHDCFQIFTFMTNIISGIDGVPCHLPVLL